MNKKIRILVALFIFSTVVTAQRSMKYSINQYNFQYGFSLKGTVEFGYKSTEPIPGLRLSVDAGVGSNFISSWLHPCFNTEIEIYNGGMGSKNQKKHKNCKWDIDVIAALTATAGFHNNYVSTQSIRLIKRDIPLYYFSDFVYPALQNPYNYSLSLGTNIIFTSNNEKGNQRVGFINFHFDRVQFSYYNDGGAIISDSYLGDKKDRNYTGGGVVSYHGKPCTAFSLIELSYKKYTGYTKNAFEISNKLFLNYMNYHTAEQRQYNKSVWSLNVANPWRGWAVKLTNYNKVSWDMQHYIHWGLFNTYHMVPYKSYWTLSGSYADSHTKAGIQ